MACDAFRVLNRKSSACALGALLAVLMAAPIEAVLIDDFNVDDKPIIDSGSYSTAASNSIGGAVSFTLSRVAGANSVEFTFNPLAGVTLDVNAAGAGTSTRAMSVISWDGNLDAAVLDPIGLGGVDLTVGGSAFNITITSASAGVELIMNVLTDGANSSFATLVLPAVAASTDFLIPYSQFAAINGGGADFSNVGAISLTLQATEPRSVTVQQVETVGASVEVTMADLFTNDADIGATAVGPGDQIKYRITVDNTGGDALGLSVEIDTGLDTNATVSSVSTQPIAANDTYVAVGNVARDVAVGEGTLVNDADPDGDTPQVDIGNSDVASAQGGTVAWNDVGGGLGDGAFVYTPPAGFRGIDTFSYTAVDDDGRNDTGAVSVLINSTVWFVDNTDGGANLGTLGDPFQSITPTNLNGVAGAGDADGPGDIIFFFTGSGTYAGGLELEDGQTVLGPEDGLMVQGVVVVVDNDDARPTITAAAGNGITLAQDNTIRALNIGNTPAGTGLIGSDFGTLTASEVAINGTGIAADLTTGTAAAVFDSIASTSGTKGIDLDAVGGSFVVSGSTTIDGTTGTAIAVANGGSTYDFGAASIGQSSTVDSGVMLSSSATSTFDFASLVVSSDAGPALMTSGAGTVRVAGGANSLSAVNSGALDLSSTAFDGSFATVTADANGAASAGIRLASLTDADGFAPMLVIGSTTIDDTTASGITISGTSGEVEINGGTIASTTEVGNAASPAIDISGGAADVTIATAISGNTDGRSVNVANRTGGTVTLEGLITDTGLGILADTNGTGIVEFRGGMTLNTGANTAFAATGGGIVNVCATNDCAAGSAVSNRIGSTTALTKTAVNIDSTTIGAEGVTFQSISVDQVATSPDVPGILLTSTGGGTFSVTGTGSTAGSGGTIENITDSDGIRLSSTGGRVTLRNMIIEDIGDASDASDGIGTVSQVDGVHAQNVTGGLTIRGTTMRRFSDNAILGAAFAGGGATTFVGLDIIDSTFEDSNRFHVGAGAGGRGDDSTEGMVRVIGLSGTVMVDNSTFRRGGQLLDILTASSGLLAMTVQRSNFELSMKEFICAPPGTVNVGKAGLSVRVAGSADLDLFVGDPAQADSGLGNTFLDNGTASIVVLHDSGAATGEIDTIISRNTFRVLDHLTGPAGCPGGSFQFNSPQGGVFLGPGSGTFEGIVSNNLFDQLIHADGGLGQLTVTFDDGGDAELIVRGNTFTLPWDAAVRLLADGNNSAAVLFGGPNVGDPNIYVDGVVGSAGDDVGGPTTSPFNPWSVNVRNGGSLDLKIENEILPQHDDVFSAFNHSFDASINATGGTMNLHITDSVSPDGYRFDISGGTLNLFNEENVAACPRTAAQILDDNGNTGGSNSDATDPPVVIGAGTTCSTTPPTAPNVMIP